MHCKYCGHALPLKGIVCPNCGKTISKEELQEQKQNELKEWDYYSNQNTAKYKSEQHNENYRKAYLFIILAICIFILIAVLKMLV